MEFKDVRTDWPDRTESLSGRRSDEDGSDRQLRSNRRAPPPASCAGRCSGQQTRPRACRGREVTAWGRRGASAHASGKVKHPAETPNDCGSGRAHKGSNRHTMTFERDWNTLAATPVRAVWATLRPSWNPPYVACEAGIGRLEFVRNVLRPGEQRHRRHYQDGGSSPNDIIQFGRNSAAGHSERAAALRILDRRCVGAEAARWHRRQRILQMR